MLELFSTRELATGIYIILALVYGFWKPKVRKSLIDLFKCLLSPKLVIPALVMCSIGILSGYMASGFSFWDNVYYKDIVMWIIFVGFPLSFGAISAKGEHYFKNAVIDNLKVTALFECLFSTFTFSLFVELMIIPVVALAAGIEVLAKREERTRKVADLMNILMAIIGFVMLWFSVEQALVAFYLETAYSMLASLVIPFVLSVLYVPFAYLLALYAAYELAFLRMSFCEPKSHKTKLKHRIKAVIACNISLHKVRLLSNRAARNMYISMPESKFDAFIEHVASKQS